MKSPRFIYLGVIYINKILDKIYLDINEDILSLGFEIEYIEYVKEFNNYILRIVVDKLDGKNMGTEDCENISRKIEDKVDELMSKEYILEVSSPGFERALKNKRLYKKYKGSEIFIKLFKKIESEQNSLKEFNAILVDSDDEKIKVKYNDNYMYIYFKDIACAHTVYDYSINLERDGI